MPTPLTTCTRFSSHRPVTAPSSPHVSLVGCLLPGKSTARMLHGTWRHRNHRHSHLSLEPLHIPGMFGHWRATRRAVASSTLAIFLSADGTTSHPAHRGFPVVHHQRFSSACSLWRIIRRAVVLVSVPLQFQPMCNLSVRHMLTAVAITSSPRSRHWIRESTFSNLLCKIIEPWIVGAHLVVPIDHPYQLAPHREGVSLGFSGAHFLTVQHPSILGTAVAHSGR